MYPEFRGEYVKKGFTLDILSDELRKRGYKTTTSHLSQLLSGAHKITLKMAKDLKTIIGSEMPLEKLFETREGD